MSKLKPIYVTLKEGRHKTQPWTFVIDSPGPQKGETKRERYVSMWSAKRGAKRVLQVIQSFEFGHYYVWDNKAKKERHVKFIVQRLPKKRK
jgi:hypothetical protein